jgi:hypothetical protein
MTLSKAKSGSAWQSYFWRSVEPCELLEIRALRMTQVDQSWVLFEHQFFNASVLAAFGVQRLGCNTGLEPRGHFVSDNRPPYPCNNDHYQWGQELSAISMSHSESEPVPAGR